MNLKIKKSKYMRQELILERKWRVSIINGARRERNFTVGLDKDKNLPSYFSSYYSEQ
jgi:hypothetical protein